jgi:DNA-binding LacI/PurR family transcriptional regulator
VDGLILNPVSSETSAVQPGVSLPPVVMTGEVDSPAVDRVRVNNVAAVWEMTEMLVKDGHRSIVLLGAIDSASYQVRRRGFRGALVSAGLPVSRETALDRPPVSVTVPWSLLTRESTATAPATPDRSGDRHRLPDDQPTARNRGDDATILSQEA